MPPPKQWRAKKQTFCKNAQWMAKKTPSLLQTFCKKSQWMAKKLRERGSNAARQPRKGGGGLPIRSQSVAIRSGRCRRLGRNRSRFGRNRSRFGRNRSQSVAIRCTEDTEDTEDTEGKAPKTSRKLDFVFEFGRNRSQSVAIGRDSVHRRQGANTKKARFPTRGNRAARVAMRCGSYSSANSSCK